MRAVHIERFFKKIVWPGQITACWKWSGCTATKGYGRIYVDGKHVYVHRFSYELFREPVPEDRVIDHLCRNRECVNPLHLEAVTTQTNVLRGETKAAANAAKTHCAHGHALSSENVQLVEGKRRCRPCWQEKNHRRSRQTLRV